MGHIAGKEEILKQLRKRLHQNPIGLPEHPSVYEILAILFTDKEAEVGSKFPFGVVTIEELQRVTGMNKDELEEILKGMMKKGLVITSKKDHEVRYILSMSMVGFFEFTFEAISGADTRLPKHTGMGSRIFFTRDKPGSGSPLQRCPSKS